MAALHTPACCRCPMWWARGAQKRFVFHLGEIQHIRLISYYVVSCLHRDFMAVSWEFWSFKYILKETDVFWKCYTEINRILFHLLSCTWQLALNALTIGQHFSLQFLQLPISNRTSKSTKQRGQQIHRAAITNDRLPGSGLDTCLQVVNEC